MIQWNKVTWYSKLLAAILFILVLPAWMFYLGVQWGSVHEIQSGLTASSNNTQTLGFKSSSYRCGDGSEFTLIYSVDKESIHVIPASNIEIIPNTVVSSLPTGSLTRYEGGGVSLFIQGDNVRVTVGAHPDVLICHSF